jgi:hypothetical protein
LRRPLSFQHDDRFLGVTISVALNAALKTGIIHPGRRHPHETLLKGMEHQLPFVVQVEFAHDRLAMSSDRLRGQSQALACLRIVGTITNDRQDDLFFVGQGVERDVSGLFQMRRDRGTDIKLVKEHLMQRRG